MILSASQLESIIKRYGDDARTEWSRLARLDRYVEGKHDKPRFENNAEERKYDELWKSSTINLVGQTVNVYRQRLAVDGFRANRLDEQDASTPWSIWNRSGMDAKQKRLFALALTHGYSYLHVGSSTDLPGAALGTTSGRTVWCHYQDPDDDWPEFALQTRKGSDGETVWRVWDDESIWTVPIDNLGAPMTSFITSESHGTGVVPFSRLEMDWGTIRACGLVEPLMPLNNMINRITFVLNLIGENSSFALRYMTGVEPEVNPETGKAVEPKVGPNKLMVITEPSGKMGQLDPSDPTGLLKYWHELVEKYFSLGQIPPHYMIGQLANLSAEALIAAESTFAFALNDATRLFGHGIDRALRLASAVAGDAVAAGNPSSKVLWQSVQVDALAAVVDALGKMVTQLGVPREGAWSRIPGITNEEIERWKGMLSEEERTSALSQLPGLMGMSDLGSGSPEVSPAAEGFSEFERNGRPRV